MYHILLIYEISKLLYIRVYKKEHTHPKFKKMRIFYIPEQKILKLRLDFNHHII